VKSGSIVKFDALHVEWIFFVDIFCGNNKQNRKCHC